MKSTHSIHEHMNRFAIAIAGIVTVLALASPAPGEIVYTPVNIVFGIPTSYHLSLNHKGTDFTFTISGCVHVLDCISLSGVPAPGDGAIRVPLNAGEVIGPAKVFSGKEEGMAYCGIPVNPYCGGPWANANAYLGVRFQLNGENHYGWVSMKVNWPYLFYEDRSLTLTGYAYETTPGLSIKAGQTQ